MNNFSRFISIIFFFLAIFLMALFISASAQAQCGCEKSKGSSNSVLAVSEQSRTMEWQESMREWRETMREKARLQKEISEPSQKRAEERKQEMEQIRKQNQERFITFSSNSIEAAIKVIQRMQIIVETAKNIETKTKAETLAKLENIKTELINLQSQLNTNNLNPQQLVIIGRKIRQAALELRDCLQQRNQLIREARISQLAERLSILIPNLKNKIQNSSLLSDTEKKELEQILEQTLGYLEQVKTCLKAHNVSEAKNLVFRIREQIRLIREKLSTFLELQNE